VRGRASPDAIREEEPICRNGTPIGEMKFQRPLITGDRDDRRATVSLLLP